MNKKIVIYFSYTGNTRKIAEKIKKDLDCDILEIKPKIPYSTDYQTVVDEEQRMEGSNHTPEINKINVNLDNYDTIILGTPVWWYRPAPAIRSFLTKYDLTGKTVIPFATNAGWLGKTFIEIKNMCPNSNVKNNMNIVFESYSDNLVTSAKEIEQFIDSLK